MPTFKSWWWVPLSGLLGVAAMAALVTSWVVAGVTDAASDALVDEGLTGVEVVGIDGGPSLGGDGLIVVLEGPAGLRSAAIVAVQASPEVDRVVYRSTALQGEAGR
ncbi:MAG: hypothetical protein AAF547_21595 [Actinomycetota bacterium]